MMNRPRNAVPVSDQQFRNISFLANGNATNCRRCYHGKPKTMKFFLPEEFNTLFTLTTSLQIIIKSQTIQY